MLLPLCSLAYAAQNTLLQLPSWLEDQAVVIQIYRYTDPNNTGLNAPRTHRIVQAQLKDGLVKVTLEVGTYMLFVETEDWGHFFLDDVEISDDTEQVVFGEDDTV